MSNMQAVKSQIPVTESQKVVQTTGLKQDLNSLWAIVRRLKQRVAELELQLSCCRRDINRIDKKVYRSSDDLPSAKKGLPDGVEAIQKFTNDFLFGGS